MGSQLGIGFWFCIVMFLAVALLAPSILMRIEMQSYIYSDVANLPPAETGLVLGASVIHGKPSPALAARTEKAVELFKSGGVKQLIITGAVEPNYDEVTPMKEFLLSSGVPAKDIVTDTVGFDTYSSVFRSRFVYGADSLVIVTQDFHLPRALFIAHALHIKAYGIVVPKGARLYDYLREIPASWKALFDILSSRLPAQTAILVPISTSTVQQ